MLFHQTHEPAIHEAVLHNQYDALMQFAQQKESLQLQNAHGLTAVELANYLGKTHCANLLRPPVHRTIPVIRRNQQQIAHDSTEKFREEFGVTYLPHLRFESYALLKKVIKNCPWTLKSGFLGEENRQLGVLYRWEINAGYLTDYLIKWVSDDIGYGLFTTRDLVEGAFIGEYTGVVRPLYRLHPNHNPYCFHYPTRFWSWNYFMIDAMHEGNALRFSNHSDHPNLKPICICDRGLLHLIFVANQRIPKGTELTFDYGRDYWRKRQKIKGEAFVAQTEEVIP